MELKKLIASSAHYWMPSGFRQKLFNESWMKDQLTVSLRENDESLILKTIPLPYLELQFIVKNDMPVSVQVYSCSVEIWIGKPVIQFTCPISESLRPFETRQSFRAYTFLNNFQADLINPTKKDSLPPNVTVNLTIHARCDFGPVDKMVKINWKPVSIR